MLARRLIPCLDVAGGRVVKGVHFRELRDAGDPAEQAARYDAEGADERKAGERGGGRGREMGGKSWFGGDASPPDSKSWSGWCDCKTSERGRSC